MAEFKSDNLQVTLAPEEQAIIVRDGITVQFNGSGGVTVLQNGITVYPPPANDSAPQAQPAPAGDHDKTPGKVDAWPTKEFIASAQQGQKLPDNSVHIQLKDGSHWAVAANVATPRSYGCGSDLGPVGQWMAEQNQSSMHGHADWQMPNSTIGRTLYDLRQQGELKSMFASVRGLWLAEHGSNYARVQGFDDGCQDDILIRLNVLSVCAVRRLDI